MKPTQNKTFTQKLKGFFLKILIRLVLAFAGFFAFIYFVPYSEGTRSGELIKFSRKGVVFKTWEGELSQGISGAQIFHFSVSRSDKTLIADLERYQGKYVKLNYRERYKAISWWGDTVYFITGVEEEDSPFLRPKQINEE